MHIFPALYITMVISVLGFTANITMGSSIPFTVPSPICEIRYITYFYWIHDLQQRFPPNILCYPKLKNYWKHQVKAASWRPLLCILKPIQTQTLFTMPYSTPASTDLDMRCWLQPLPDEQTPVQTPARGIVITVCFFLFSLFSCTTQINMFKCLFWKQL